MNRRSLLFATHCWVKLSFFICMTILFLLPSVLVAADDQPSLQQLVDQHTRALGGAERRSQTKSRVARGKAELIPGRGSGLSQMVGEAIFYSKAPNKVRMDFLFGEFGIQRGFNGTDAWIKPTPPTSDGAMTKAITSLLKSGGMLHEISVYDGLIEAFQLEDKFKVKGTKKINDIETYQLEYKPSGVTSKLFMDTTNGYHLRTAFSVLYNPAANPASIAGLGGSQGRSIGESPMSSAGAFSGPTSFTVEMDTGDYRDVNGINLPHAYCERLPFYTIKITILHYEENVDLKDIIFDQ